ncbi:hypothetical protein E3U43_007396 [Larimichthys crocea]|uniref:Uncharacterized protein n=1 Tax=Larimichthys crocea TaxID=215358 RepID=A0ACD3Q3Z6_LARCR|nr:hypothetical protein E3U43_007396 [Larimichthys crocea]
MGTSSNMFPNAEADYKVLFCPRCFLCEVLSRCPREVLKECGRMTSEAPFLRYKTTPPHILSGVQGELLVDHELPQTHDYNLNIQPEEHAASSQEKDLSSFSEVS